MTSATTSAAPGGTESGDFAALRRYRRAANYLTAAQLYLRDNVLLRRPLTPGDVKPRLVGNWGTAPGINLAYAHLDRLVRARGLDVLLVTGPGHGAAANLANMYLDLSLAEFYPEMGHGVDRLTLFVRGYAWPGGFPSHLTPATPGAIHEGGEVGYALATAFGAALDDPDLLVACLVGDGEAETGATAASWNANRFLDPATSGAVLPILHVNGYKAGSASISGAMSDAELETLYRGYGYEPLLVEGVDDALDVEMADALDRAADAIGEIQAAARRGERVEKPRWPMIVLRTPKGWTAPARLDGLPVTGSPASHAVPAADLRTNAEHLAAVEAWLRSYGPDELFDEAGVPAADIREFAALGEKRLALNARANGGLVRKPLELPDAALAAVPVSRRGGSEVRALERTAIYLAEVMRRSADARNFRLFAPDELETDELGAVLDVSGRAFTWPVGAGDEHVAPDGRIVEVLSEEICEGLLEGYLKTGRHGVFVCSEGYVQTVFSEIGQFARWLRLSADVNWRPPVSSLNLLLTSDAWQADADRDSHQNPGLINGLLQRRSAVLRVTLPPDANTLVETVARCLHSVGYVNVVVATRGPLPQWLSMAEARAHATAGASIWRWASTNEGVDPDVVLAAAGAVPTQEVLAARELLARDLPDLRVRVVNVMDLMRLDSRGHHPHALDADAFEALFTADRHVVFSFQGYPSGIHQLISGRLNPTRFHVRGYTAEGVTTTPFDRLVRNGTSRYQLAIEAIRRAGRVASGGSGVIDRYLLALEEHQAYIVEHGEDPADITGWRWGAA